MYELEEFCQIVQQDLNDVSGANAPMLKRGQYGFIDALVSETNTSGVEQIQVDPGNGKIRQVQLEYIKPGDRSETVDTPGDACEPGDEVDTNHVQVPVEKYRAVKITFTRAQFRKFCDAPSTHRAKVVSSKLDGLTDAINRDLLALYATKYGGFINGGTGPKDVNLVNRTNNIPQANYDGEIVMMEDMADLGITQKPIVVGSNIWSQYSRLQGVGCCNDFGTDVSELGDFMFYRDRAVNEVIPAGVATKSTGVVFAPGAVQLLHYIENAGEFTMSDKHLVLGTYTDPFTGITYDMEVQFDRCDKVWVITLSLHYDLFTHPLDAYNATDDRFGSNSTFLYNAVSTVTP